MKNFIYALATDKLSGIVYAPLKSILWILSLIYRALVRWNYRLYQNGFLKVSSLRYPVISVGNITLGGVGKTPLVEFISHYFIDQGIKPVILMRGYMDRKNIQVDNVSDEAKLLRESLKIVPVLVGPNRLENAQKLPQEFLMDVFILDDGFQHWKIKRDLNIVVLDTTNPFGNGQLIPRGILREPLDGLVRADVIILSRTDFGKENVSDIKSRLRAVGFNGLVVESIHEPVTFINPRNNQKIPLFFIEKKKVAAFSSIGNPAALEKSLTKLGAAIEHHFIFMDHFIYTREDVEKINQWCLANNISYLVTTQKDAVKLEHLWTFFDSKITVLVLHIRLSMTSGKERFLDRINSLLPR